MTSYEMMVHFLTQPEENLKKEMREAEDHIYWTFKRHSIIEQAGIEKYKFLSHINLVEEREWVWKDDLVMPFIRHINENHRRYSDTRIAELIYAWYIHCLYIKDDYDGKSSRDFDDLYKGIMNSFSDILINSFIRFINDLNEKTQTWEELKESLDTFTEKYLAFLQVTGIFKG